MQDRIITVDLDSLGDLSPNEFCLLVDIIKNNGKGWLNPTIKSEYDLFNKLLSDLEKKLYIKISGNNVLLRKKGHKIRLGLDSNTIRKTAVKHITTNDFVDKYRKLFKGKKVGAMGDRNACIKKFKWFFDMYPQYDEEIILTATEKYIKSCRNNEYVFLQQADYFIRKQDVDKIERSRLASYCEELDDKNEGSDTGGPSDHFIEML